MQLRDVLLKATARQITWGEAAEIIGVSDRTIQRWRERLERDAGVGAGERRETRLTRRTARGSRTIIQEREDVIVILDEITGAVADSRLSSNLSMQKATSMVAAALESAPQRCTILSDQAGYFLTSVERKMDPPRKRGMSLAPPVSNPARLRN